MDRDGTGHGEREKERGGGGGREGAKRLPSMNHDTEADLGAQKSRERAMGTH